MNKRLVANVVSSILLVEAAAMLPSLLLALYYGDGDAYALTVTILITLAVSIPVRVLVTPKERVLRARDGYGIVAFSWVFLALFGALPFVIHGMIPNYIDAVFETISGFTTTGATILTNFDGLPRGLMFWRAFTHWIGGMGVLVLTMALLPKLTARTSHLMRAESPGPTMSKVLPKMADTAKALYSIYIILTLAEFFMLWMAGMSPYDAAIHTLSTAGTGGFSNYGASVGAFDSALIDGIVTFFMLAFGVNFALYFHLFTGNWRELVNSEELRVYLGLFVFSAVFTTAMILPQYGDILTSFRYASFQIASFMSTTGFTTANFNAWPESVRMLLIVLMFVGSCAGSTAGGMKVVRVAISVKQGRREISRTVQPRKISVIKFEGKSVDEHLLHQISVFMFVYFGTVIVGAFLLSLDGRFSFETNFSSALSCVSNIGPILGGYDNMYGYSYFAKIVMCMLMLAGRLELFPILALFHPDLYRR